jgi:hypothetical protein
VLSPEGTRIGVGWHDRSTGKTVIPPATAGGGLPAWLPDGRRFVYATSDRTLSMFNTITGTGGPLGKPFDFEVLLTISPTVSPDGRTIIVPAGQAEADIWMVERER